jgi:hypothetical protein
MASDGMYLKGLLEWKIFAAIFAVLIVASSAVFGGSGFNSTFFNSTGGGLDLGSLPFASLFSHTEEDAKAPVTQNDVVVELMVERMPFSFGSPVQITSGDFEMTNFTGSVEFDFLANTSLFTPSGSGITIRKATGVTQVNGAAIESLVLESADYSVLSGGSDTTGKDDRLEIQGFSGTITASDRITLAGTVSSVTNGKWKIG